MLTQELEHEKYPQVYVTINWYKMHKYISIKYSCVVQGLTIMEYTYYIVIGL